MTLYIKMRIPRFGFAAEVLKSKIDVTATLLSYLSGIFMPRRIELWRNAPSESLDGRVVKRIEIERGSAASSISLLIDRMIKNISIEPIKTIIIIEGILNVKSDKEEKAIPAYLAMYNNPEWRAVYGDIEFDIYPSRLFEKVNNLSDVYIMNADLRDKLNAVIRRLMSMGRGRVDKIVIGYSPDAINIITERVESTNPSGPSFIIDIIRTIRYEAEEMGYDYARKITTYIKPYKELVVASRLWRLREFKPFFESVMKVSNIHRDTYLSAGLMLYTVDKEGFKKFHKIMVERFFEPFSAELIDLETLVSKMRKVITRTRSLDEYSER